MPSDNRNSEPDNETYDSLETNSEDIVDATLGDIENATFLAGPSNASTTVEDTTSHTEPSASTATSNDEHNSGMFRCVTDTSNSANILSARAGHSRAENGPRLLPRWKPGAVVTYSIDWESFPSKKSAKFAQRALFYAASDWNRRDVGVQFHRGANGQKSVFSLKYYPAPQGFFAESFFPDSKNRTLYIFKFAFKKKHRRHMSNVFRHELGHILGLRHEEAEMTESKLPSVALTPLNTHSIMRFFTNPGGLVIQDSDAFAVKKLSQIEGEYFEGFKVITVDPDALEDHSSSGSEHLSSGGSNLTGTETGGSGRSSTEQQPPPLDLQHADPSEVTTDQTEVRRTRAPLITIEVPPPGEEHTHSHPTEDTTPASPRPSVVETAQPPYPWLSVPIHRRRPSPPPHEEEEAMVRRGSNERDTKHDPQPDAPQLDVQDALTPDPGTEHMFIVENNPFAFSPGQLNKLFEPKNHSAFYALGGLRGLEIGLRTDRAAGLSLDEATMEGMVTFEEAASKDASKYGALGEKAPEAAHKEHQMPDTPNNSTRRNNRDGFGGGYTDRKRVFQTNRLPRAAAKSILQIARDVYCSEWLLILLTVSAVASSAWGIHDRVAAPSQESQDVDEHWTHGVAILVGIASIVGIETLYQWITQRYATRMEAIRAQSTAKIVRSGLTVEVDVAEILVGDVILLAPGDIAPADGILIDGHGLECNEAHCTGESDTMKKVSGDVAFTILDQAVNESANEFPNSVDPFILSGSEVLGGTGSFIATAVGVNSGYGRIQMSCFRSLSLSSYRRRLQDLGTKTVRKLGIAVGILLFTVCTIKFLANLPSSNLKAEEKTRNFLNMLLLILAFDVAIAVPFSSHTGELITAIIVARLGKDNALVRDNRTTETAAEVTTICTGKTGLLTQNRMDVVAVTLGSKRSFGNTHGATDLTNSSGNKQAPIKDMYTVAFAKSLSSEERELLLGSIAINSTAHEGVVNGRLAYMGSQTEIALLRLGREVLGFGPIQEERSNASTAEILPFTSRNKFTATMVRLSNGRWRVYVKGAAEVLLEQCSRIITVEDPTSGKVSATPLTDENRRLYCQIVTAYGSRSLRPIVLCYRDADCRLSLDDGTVCQDMTLIAVVGLQDPLRCDILDAIRQCHDAGITVRMVTGDHIETARAVAKETGILEDDSVVMEGSVFRCLTSESQLEVIPRLRLLARASAEDKRILVQRLGLHGETVAVTGGRGSDAPALKIAEVGFAKGIAGTEVAVKASDVVLMDDHFMSVVKSILWSRAAKDSHAKSLQFKLTAISAASALTFCTTIAADLSDDPLLNPAQLLWVALVTSMSAFTLLVSSFTKAVRQRNPSGNTASLFTLTIQKMVLGQIISHLLITSVAYFGWFAVFGRGAFPLTTDDKIHRNTFVFNTFIWLQIFNILNSQRLDNHFNVFEGTFQNRLFFLIGFIIAGGQILILFVGSTAFKVVHLNGGEWAISVALGGSSLISGSFLRLLPSMLIDRLTPDIMKRRSQVASLAID